MIMSNEKMVKKKLHYMDTYSFIVYTKRDDISKDIAEDVENIYLKLTLVFMWDSELRKSLSSVFQEFSTSINKIFILVGTPDTKLSFHKV